MFKSGKGRHKLNLKYSGTFKLFHLFPTFFIIGFILSNIYYLIDFSDSLNIFQEVYSLYFILIFINSSIINKNLIIGLLSIITTFIQFLGYGLGYVFSIIK